MKNRFIKIGILALILLLIYLPTILIYNYFQMKRVDKMALDICSDSVDDAIVSKFLEKKKNRILLVPALIKIAKDEDRDYGIRSAAIISLEISGVGLETLCGLLFDKDSRVRFIVSDSLGEIGDKKAVNDLLQAWTDESVLGVKWAIAMALGRIGDEKAIPTFLKSYKKGDTKTQLISAMVICKLSGDEKYFNVIAQAMDSKKYEIRGDVIFMAGKLGYADERFMLLLEKALDDEDLRIRKLARISIDKINTHSKSR